MDLGNDHIPKLIRQIAVPASVGMFFNTMYNVVDTFWAGQLSSEALAALSLSLVPFIGLLAIGFGLGQGTNALISNALGENNNFILNLYFFIVFNFSKVVPDGFRKN